VKSVLAGLIVLGGLASALPAVGECPPLAERRERPLLERLILEHGDRSKPLSDRELAEIMRRDRLPPMMGAGPRSGPAPLEVQFDWSGTDGLDLPATAEFSADGQESPRPLAPRELRLGHKYARPGRYEPAITIVEKSGRVHRLTTVIDVLMPADFEAQLQGRWATLKERLRARDVAGALECVAERRRERFFDIFNDVFLGQGQRVDDVLTAIRPVTRYPGAAVYEMLRRENGQTMSYEVRFSIDRDGVWRIESF